MKNKFYQKNILHNKYLDIYKWLNKLIKNIIRFKIKNKLLIRYYKKFSI